MGDVFRPWPYCVGRIDKRLDEEGPRAWVRVLGVEVLVPNGGQRGTGLAAVDYVVNHSVDQLCYTRALPDVRQPDASIREHADGGTAPGRQYASDERINLVDERPLDRREERFEGVLNVKLDQFACSFEPFFTAAMIVVWASVLRL